jgi:alpha-ribazole phosphatase
MHELRPDLTYKTDPRLQEMDFGAWEGRAWQDIAPRAASLDRRLCRTMPWAAAAKAPCRSWRASPRPLTNCGARSDTLWITHAGVIRAAELIARGVRQICKAEEWPVNAPAYGQWCKLELQAHS